MREIKENNNFKPMVFWAWNGDMEEAKMRKQIEEFAAAGFGALNLHARAGLTIPYLGEQWMRSYEIAIEECRRHGIDIWIYDEQGWPSGFAGGKVNEFGEDYQLKFLNRSFTYDPSFAGRIVSAYRKSADGYERTEQIETADLYIYYDVQEHYVDLLNPNVGKEFINCTHEVYKRRFGKEFGKTIKGVFTDEPQIHVSARAWSVTIPEAFQKKYGESVFDTLYLLFDEEGEGYQEFRYRYYSVVRELFINNYTRQISGWCEKNGLIFTGHLAGEEGLCVQVASNTGVMPHYEFMRQPAIDHLGRRLNPVLLTKQVSSVAHQMGKKRILSETYACTGNGVSFGELAWIWNYQAAFGVNLPCMSISMYRLGGIRKRDYPVFLSSQQPWWEECRAFSEFITHTSEFVTRGEYSADVLVVSAVNSALEEPIFSLKQRNVSAKYRRLAEDLVWLQIPYDIGDETILARHGKVKGGRITVGKGSYGIVIVPELDNVASSTLDLLEKFAAEGGKIVCMSALPTRTDGKAGEEASFRLKAMNVDIIQQRRGIIGKYFETMHFKRKICVYEYNGKLAQNVMLTYRTEGSCENIVLFNPSSNASLSGTLVAEGKGRFVSFNGKTGEETEQATAFGNGCSMTEIRLPAQGALYYRFVPAEEELLLPEPETIEKDLSFRLTGLDDNVLTIDYARYRFGEEEFSPRMPVIKLLDEIYDRAENYEGTSAVCVEYTFRTSTPIKKIALAGETAGAKAVYVNGVELSETQEYFLDRDFKKYDISPYVKVGENRITVAFEITPLRLGFKLNEVHDAVRNKFSYPVAVESVYLTGDFSVNPDGAVINEINHIGVDGGFCLSEPKELPTRGDITACGRWFYAGNAEYKATVPKMEGKTFLHLTYAGAAASVYVNGQRAGAQFLAGEKIEITQYLVKDENEVTIRLLGTLRNMLGPHHHFKGDTEYTGVHTFTGEYGNGAIEDLSSAESPDAVWTDVYGFIRFGLYKVRLINRK